MGSFLLIGSWASNIAEMLVAPFMLLFSYAVAREMLQHPTNDSDFRDSRSPLLREMIRGSHVATWQYFAEQTYKRGNRSRAKPSDRRVVDIAASGLVTATLLT